MARRDRRPRRTTPTRQCRHVATSSFTVQRALTHYLTTSEHCIRSLSRPLARTSCIGCTDGHEGYRRGTAIPVAAPVAPLRRRQTFHNMFVCVNARSSGRFEGVINRPVL